MQPLQRGAALFPAAAIRSDPGLLLTAARFIGPEMLALGLVAGQLTVGIEIHSTLLSYPAVSCNFMVTKQM